MLTTRVQPGSRCIQGMQGTDHVHPSPHSHSFLLLLTSTGHTSVSVSWQTVTLHLILHLSFSFSTSTSAQCERSLHCHLKTSDYWRTNPIPCQHRYGWARQFSRRLSLCAATGQNSLVLGPIVPANDVENIQSQPNNTQRHNTHRCFLPPRQHIPLLPSRLHDCNDCTTHTGAPSLSLSRTLAIAPGADHVLPPITTLRTLATGNQENSSAPLLVFQLHSLTRPPTLRRSAEHSFFHPSFLLTTLSPFL